MKIVVTGGIGSGKSTVVSHLRTLLDDYEFFDMDEYVKGLYDHAYIRSELMRVFGTDVKSEISSIVYQYPSDKQKLYDIMNQHIIDELNNASHARNIVFDMPLYFEMTHMIALVPDLIVCVACSSETQKQRIRIRNGFSDQKIDSIIAQQLPVSEKKRMSDIVIDSNGSIQSTIDATTMMVVNLGI